MPWSPGSGIGGPGYSAMSSVRSTSSLFYSSSCIYVHCYRAACTLKIFKLVSSRLVRLFLQDPTPQSNLYLYLYLYLYLSPIRQLMNLCERGNNVDKSESVSNTSPPTQPVETITTTTATCPGNGSSMPRGGYRHGNIQPSLPSLPNPCLQPSLSNICFIWFRGPGAAARQAAELRREGVEVEDARGAMGESTVNFGRYGWFPDMLPSEAAEIEAEREEEDGEEEGSE